MGRLLGAVAAIRRDTGPIAEEYFYRFSHDKTGEN
jgi:hypothetical protein